MTDKELDEWSKDMRGYIRAYVEDYAAQLIYQRTRWMYYIDYGIMFIGNDKVNKFPSFSHWKFNKSFNRNRFGVQPF